MKNEKELFDSSWENEKMTTKKNHKIILKKKNYMFIKKVWLLFSNAQKS